MYEKLFSPVKIGRMDVKNRVAMTSMGVNLAAAGGGVNDDIIAFYEARARGGVGLIISGVCRVLDGVGASEPRQLAARDPGDISGLEQLVDAVHKYNTKMLFQLHHPGREYAMEEGEPVAASAVERPYTGTTPRALTAPEIEQIQEAFVKGAWVTQMAGADGVELHGAHGYLINSFLSPYLNRREDDYGGSLENRMRFLLEIVAGIRAVCGESFPLGVRLSAEEFLGDRGNDLAATCRIAQELEKAGVHFLDISNSIPDSEIVAACIEPGTWEQGWKKYMARDIKEHVGIPLIAVANIKEPDVAEEILQEGCCDLVGVARGHLADAAWCNKAKADKAETISKCIGCLVCFDEIEHRRRIKCSVNPTTGREREFAHPKRDGAGRPVVIVGAGPAGFTAAMVLKDRDFRPVVFDPSSRLGGTLHTAVGADRSGLLHRQRKITRLIDSMVARVEEQGIEIRLGEDATIDRVNALAPCGVFIGAGAQPFIPPIPGINGDNVVTAEDYLAGRTEVEGDCVIIGSGMTGLETAEAVAAAGHKTTIADMLPEIGVGAEIVVILDMKQRLAQYDPSYLPGHRLTAITPEGVELEPVEDGSTVFVPANTVILAMGVRPRNDVVDYIQDHYPDARVMGDAVRGGRIVDATQDAYGQAFVFEP